MVRPTTCFLFFPLQAITKLQIGGPTGTGTWEFVTACLSVSLNKTNFSSLADTGLHASPRFLCKLQRQV